jgi:hypothetical protein
VLCKLHWQLALQEFNRSRLSGRDRAREDFLASPFRYDVTIGALKSAKKADNGSWLPASNGRACGATPDAVMSLEERVQFVRILNDAYGTSWLTGNDNLAGKWQAIALLLAETVPQAPYRTMPFLQKELARLKTLCTVSSIPLCTV